MGYHVRHIPEVESLKRMRENATSDEEFLRNLYGRAESFVIPKDSAVYLEEIKQRIKEAPNELRVD